MVLARVIMRQGDIVEYIIYQLKGKGEGWRTCCRTWNLYKTCWRLDLRLDRPMDGGTCAEVRTDMETASD